MSLIISSLFIWEICQTLWQIAYTGITVIGSIWREKEGDGFFQTPAKTDWPGEHTPWKAAFSGVCFKRIRL